MDHKYKLMIQFYFAIFLVARDVNKEELNIMNIIMKNTYFVPVPLTFDYPFEIWQVRD